MLELLARSRQIDRRVISVATLLMLALPLVVPLPLKMVAFPATKALKAFIDKLPPDKVVVIATDWDSATKGECQPQTAAMMDYLFKTKRKFAIYGFSPQGPEIAQKLAEKLALKYGAKYATDWVNWGYKPNTMTTLIGMMNDLPGILKTDIKQTPLTKDPISSKLHSLKDAGLLFEVTGTGILNTYLQFCAGVPLANGCTAVIGPEQYPYMQSGQLKGLLVGLGGAAQFETVTEFKDENGKFGGEGLRGMGSQSLGHLLVMLLIVLGNLGVWAQRRVERGRLGSEVG